LRQVFQEAVAEARLGGEDAFLGLSQPHDFAALLIEAGWEAWRSCFAEVERLCGA
jgi:membrane glycosyltransferase